MPPQLRQIVTAAAISRQQRAPSLLLNWKLLLLRRGIEEFGLKAVDKERDGEDSSIYSFGSGMLPFLVLHLLVDAEGFS